MANGLKTMTMFLWHVRVIKAAIWYNAVVLGVFFLVYALMDFNKHFETKQPVTLRGKAYFTIMTHTAANVSDIIPKTDFARVVMGLHVLFAWAQLLIVFLSNS